MEDLVGGGFEEVAVEDDEVGEVAGGEEALGLLAELGVGGGLGVGEEGFGEGDALLGMEGLGAGLVLAGDGGVEAAERGDGFDGVVGAEGEGDVVVQHAAPGVGVFAALGAEAGPGPGHVGEEVRGLHGGDDAFLLEAVEVGGEQDLGVLDAVAEAIRSVVGAVLEVVADGVLAALVRSVRVEGWHGGEGAGVGAGLLGGGEGVEGNGVGFVADGVEA